MFITYLRSDFYYGITEDTLEGFESFFTSWAKLMDNGLTYTVLGTFDNNDEAMKTIKHANQHLYAWEEHVARGHVK